MIASPELGQASTALSTVVKEFDPLRVRPLPDQPRKRFRGIPQLAASIRKIGQTDAGIVTLVIDDPNFDAQLVNGERRLRACCLANVPFRAEVRPSLETYKSQFLTSIAANFQRQDHDVLEIAEALKRAKEEYKMTIAELAELCGKSDGWVVQHLSLLKLVPEVQQMLIPDDTVDDVVDESIEPEERSFALGCNDKVKDQKKRKLTFSLALLLVSVPRDRQYPIALRITSEKMSLTAARRIIYRELHKSGEKTLKSKRGPSELLSSLYSLVHQCNDRFGIFLDLPGPVFDQVIDTLDNDGKRELAEVMHELGDQIKGMADQIRDRRSVRAALAKRRTA